MKMLRLSWLAALSIMVFSACDLFNDPADDPVIEENLLGVVWDFDSLQIRDTTYVAPIRGYATLQFTEDMLFIGHGPGGYYRYHGTYSIAGDDSLSIEILEPAGLRCSRPSSISCNFIDSLKIVTTFDVNEDKLILRQGDKTAFYFRATLLYDEELLNLLWKADSLHTPDARLVRGPDTVLTIIQGDDITRVLFGWDNFMSIQFEDHMLVHGFLTCNNHYGDYEITGTGTLRLTTWQGTEAACHPRVEDIVLAAFNHVTAYQVTENRLRLQSMDGSYLIDLRP